MIRNTFRLASRRDWDRLKRDVKLIYTAPNEAAARAALDELTEAWGSRYPAIIRLWTNAWAEFVPFLDYDVEIRKIICSTNAIVILSQRDDHGCDLGFCVVVGVVDVGVQRDPVTGEIRRPVGVSRSRRRSPRASARACRSRWLSAWSARMRSLATSSRLCNDASLAR